MPVRYEPLLFCAACDKNTRHAFHHDHRVERKGPKGRLLDIYERWCCKLCGSVRTWGMK